MTCAEVLDRLMDARCGLLDASAAAALDAHRVACRTCRDAAERLARQEAVLAEHFQAMRRTDTAAAVSRRLPSPRRVWRPLLGAAAALLVMAGLWILPRSARREEALADIQVLKRGYAVTVYNEDLALVKDRRQILNLRPGINRFRMQDIPARLDPTSVRFRSDTDPDGCKVLEQNFEYDLVDQAKLLSRYVDRRIGFERKAPGGGLERLGGVLLSPDGAVRMDDGACRAAFPGTAILPELPGGLLTRPALAWVLNAPREARHDATAAYLTGGLFWKADYVMTLKDAATLDLDTWVSVTNESGATYEDAELKLVAGDVHRVREVMALTLDADNKEDNYAEGANFGSRSLGEYHLYALGRPTTLKNLETKQISLGAARGVAYRTEYVFRASEHAAVQVLRVIENRKENRLGFPMPEGTVRFLAVDPDGEVQQIGLAAMDHTAKDEALRLPAGTCVDLVAERRVPKVAWESRFLVRHTVEVRLRNPGGTAVDVEVVEDLKPGWEMLESSRPVIRKDATTAVFKVPVPAGGESVLSYVVRSEPMNDVRR